MPHLIAKAYGNGYTLAHSGQLATRDNPAAKDVPHIRAVLIAVEALFHWAFWSFDQDDNDFSLPPREAWATLPWGGANSHNPMLGKVEGEFDLTAEEREELAEVKKAHKLDATKARYANMTPEQRKARNAETEAQKLKRKAKNAARYQELTLAERKARVALAKVFRHTKDESERIAAKEESKVAGKATVADKTGLVKKTEVVKKTTVGKEDWSGQEGRGGLLSVPKALSSHSGPPPTIEKALGRISHVSHQQTNRCWGVCQCPDGTGMERP